MYSNQGVQRYRETDISSMSSEKMIVLLYERIVTDLEGAKRAIADGDRIEMTKQVNHSQRIIAELRNALDHSIGGEISQNLDALYNFMFHQHLDLLLDKDPVHIDNCLNVIAPLLDAWRQIPTGTGQKAAQDQVRGNQSPATGPEPASAHGKNKSENREHGENLSDSANRPTSLLSVSA
jgi:flagellar protein FliS